MDAVLAPDIAVVAAAHRLVGVASTGRRETWLATALIGEAWATRAVAIAANATTGTTHALRASATRAFPTTATTTAIRALRAAEVAQVEVAASAASQETVVPYILCAAW